MIGSTWQAIRATASERAARLAEDAAQRERDHAQSSRNRAVASIGGLLLQDSGDKTLMNEETRLYRKALIDAGMRESQELVRELENDGRARLLLVQAYDTLSRAQSERGDQRGGDRDRAEGHHAGAGSLRSGALQSAGRVLGSSLPHLGSIATDRETSLAAHRQSTAVFQTAPCRASRAAIARRFIQMIGLNHHDSRPSRVGAIAGFRKPSRRSWRPRDLAVLSSRNSAQLHGRSSYQAGTELYLCRAYSDDQTRGRTRWRRVGGRSRSTGRLVHDHPRRLRLFPAALPGVPGGRSRSTLGGGGTARGGPPA